MFLFKKTPSISAMELENLLTQPIELIDVRSPMEFQQEHIAKAKNVPLDRIQQYKAKKDKVYVICQSGARSKRAAQALIDQGIDAVNIQGGMMMWPGKVKVGK